MNGILIIAKILLKSLQEPLLQTWYNFEPQTLQSKGLSREFEVAIAHAIRDQVYFYKKTLLERGRYSGMD